LEKAFKEVYTRFKLHFYRHIFGTLNRAETELTVMEALAAEVIYAMGEPTMSQFAAAVGISAPNATYRVQSLVKKGYVERIASRTDRREQHLRVTRKFIDFYAINEEYISVISARIAERFPKEDTEKFAALLGTISGELMPEVNGMMDSRPAPATKDQV